MVRVFPRPSGHKPLGLFHGCRVLFGIYAILGIDGMGDSTTPPMPKLGGGLIRFRQSRLDHVCAKLSQMIA